MNDVCIHMQDVMYKSPRGIPLAIIEITRNLLRRNNNNYYLSFFDYKNERGNIKYLEDYLGEDLARGHVRKCDFVSYKDYIDGLTSNDDSRYNLYTYERSVDCQPDAIYFPYCANLPHNTVTKSVVTTIHDIMPLKDDFSYQFSESEKSRFEYAMRYLEQKQEIIITVDSNATKRDVVNRFNIDESRLVYLPMGYDEEVYYYKRDKAVLDKFNINMPYILYLGALDERKGLDVIAEVVKKGLSYDVQYVVAGKIEKNLDKDVIEVLRNSNNVILTGYVSDYEKKILMSMAEVFVFPSYYEGFGLPVVEAMACGTPVITADNSSLPEVGGEAAIYFETGNKEALAEKIDLLLGSSSIRKECVEKGYKQIKKFTWDNTAQRMEEIFEKAI